MSHPSPRTGRTHIRSKSSGYSASPALGRKSLAAPVVSDIKAVGKQLTKANEGANARLREVWHKVSELGADGKLPESVIGDITIALDNLTALVAQQHSDTLKAVNLARDAAGAMSTFTEPEQNETTTVDLDPETHGKYTSAEERMLSMRTAAASPRVGRTESGTSAGSPRSSTPSLKGGSPKAAKKLSPKAADASVPSVSIQSGDRSTLANVAAGDASNAAAAPATDEAHGSDSRKARGHARAKSVPSLTSEADADGARKMGEDGYLRSSDPKLLTVVDAAAAAMRRKKKKQAREKFLKDSEGLDAEAKKNLAAKRAAELSGENWAGVKDIVVAGHKERLTKHRSNSDPPKPPP
mmetsp:Transcript_6912/g.17796  ORF Transcript_6912/g.17796 Transcript_6912/m.17796 type:complete len:354 (+) Transcript_6912:63-1124(+)